MGTTIKRRTRNKKRNEGVRNKIVTKEMKQWLEKSNGN